MNPSVPVTGYPSRMRLYLAAMFPVPQRVAAGVLLYLGLTACACPVLGLERGAGLAATAVGSASIVLLTLILRLMDELKDRDIDRRLFPERPLPSGTVLESDIRFSLLLAVAAFVALNLVAGLGLATAVLALGYSLLMYVFFFMPKLLRRSLPLALVTHNVIVPIMCLHLLQVFLGSRGLRLRAVDPRVAAPVLAAFWAPFLAWELARKIRAPEDENAYVTYSRILGHRQAALTAFGIQTAAAVLGLLWYRRFGQGWLFLPALGAGYVLTGAACLRFLLQPTSTSAGLRRSAELFAVLFLLAFATQHLP